MLMVAGVVELVRVAISQFGPAPSLLWDTTESLIGVELLLVRLTDGRANVVPTEPDPVTASVDRIKSGAASVCPAAMHADNRNPSQNETLSIRSSDWRAW